MLQRTGKGLSPLEKVGDIGLKEDDIIIIRETVCGGGYLEDAFSLDILDTEPAYDDIVKENRVSFIEPLQGPGSLTIHEIFDITRDIWENLPVGSVLYNPPTEMSMGRGELVEVRVTNKLTENFKKKLKGRGVPQIEDIKVSPQMRAKLDGGDAFDVKKRFENDIRAITGDYTQWEWDVIPLKRGIQKLNLYITAIIEIKGITDRPRELPSFEKEIVVKVNYNYMLKHFLDKYWQWIVGTIIAIATLIIAYFGYWKPSG